MSTGEGVTVIMLSRSDVERRDRGTKLRILSFCTLLLVPGHSGGSEESHDRMREILRALRSRTASEHFYLSHGKLEAARAHLETVGEDGLALFRWEALLKLGEQEQFVGNELEAIRRFEQARALLPEVEADVAVSWIARLYFRLGVAYLRYGETKNCALHHAAESCILPVRGSGIHVDKAPSLTAAGFLERLLELSPVGSEPYLSGRWLLNLAYMTAGGYPHDVPDGYLIPPSSFESSVEFPMFDNVAQSAGVGTFTLAGSVVVEDFDTDGFLDLLVSSNDPTEPLRLFINRHDGRFTERTREANLEGITGGLNMVQADYDNDGDVDVLVLRGAWLGAYGSQHPNSLLRNNGDGTFTDITMSTALGVDHLPTQTAAWGDYDNDGDIDLYIGNETHLGFTAKSQLFRNEPDGSFSEVALEAGVASTGFTKGVVFGDFDADRFPDIYVSNLDGDNHLYRNRGDGTFHDVAASLGVEKPVRSFPAWFWDYDNDGHLDLFVSAYEANVQDLAAAALGLGYAGETSRLYRGNGLGGFTDATREAGLEAPSAPMGANFGDLDNDGYLDFYLGTGYPPYVALMPNVMYWNRAGRRFDDVTTAGGFGHLQKGHGIVFADLDADGDQDVFEQMGGALAGDKFFDVLYRNPGFGNRWLEVELSGVRSNRLGIGARIRVDVVEDGRKRSIYKHVGSGGSFGANSTARQMVGLGRASAIERVEIYWPASDETQSVANVALDSRIHVKEGSSASFSLRY